MKKTEYPAETTSAVFYIDENGNPIAGGIVTIKRQTDGYAFTVNIVRDQWKVLSMIDTIPCRGRIYSESGRTWAMVTPWLRVPIGQMYEYLNNIEEILAKAAIKTVRPES